MPYTLSDINFDKLNWKQFEELCFDLITKYPFHSVRWRQGGADDGRDIEACHTTYNLLVPQFNEKWFFECKKHIRGVSVEDIATKLSWARGDSTHHLVFITSSYITTSGHDLIEKWRGKENFKIHVIEGKHLKEVLLLFPDIIQKYFSDRYSQLASRSYQIWLYHDFLPDAKTAYNLFTNLDLNKTAHPELAFLWFVFHKIEDEIEKYCRDEHLPMFKEDNIILYLKQAKNCSYPAITKDDNAKYEITNSVGLACCRWDENDFFFASAHYKQQNNEYVQVCFFRKGDDVETRITYGISNKYFY